jgi:hypothetical protein
MGKPKAFLLFLSLLLGLLVNPIQRLFVRSGLLVYVFSKCIKLELLILGPLETKHFRFVSGVAAAFDILLEKLLVCTN